MSKKFTDEQLSRILSAHANGEMRCGGMHQVQPEKVCVMQAAFGVEVSNDGFFFSIAKELTAEQEVSVVWFDDEYKSKWTTDQFLAQLEAQGLA